MKKYLFFCSIQSLVFNLGSICYANSDYSITPLSNKPQVENVNEFKPKFTKKSIAESYLWLGRGPYYLIYQQNSKLNNAPVDYAAMAAPSVWLDFRQRLISNIGVRFEYLSQSGSKAKSESLSNNIINWSYSTFGFDYLLNKTFKVGEYFLQPSYIIAYQSHSMPFLKSIDSNSYTIDSIKFSSLSMGYYLSFKYSEFGSFFITNRLQFPVASSSELKVASGFSFDGMLGMSYDVTSILAASVYWGGQYHKLKYNYGNDSGDYVLFSSKLNFLIGVYW